MCVFPGLVFCSSERAQRSDLGHRAVGFRHGQRQLVQWHGGANDLRLRSLVAGDLGAARAGGLFCGRLEAGFTAALVMVFGLSVAVVGFIYEYLPILDCCVCFDVCLSCGAFQLFCLLKVLFSFAVLCCGFAGWVLMPPIAVSEC